MRLALAAVLLLAGTALAQAPAAPEKKEQPQPKQEPAGARLNLSIDGIDDSRGRMRFGPTEKDAGALPSLGADAREIPKTPSTGSRMSPYPPDTNPGR